ncbi:MAG: biopolymer transporter ExbD, partial [Holosporaceae bacterium]
MAFSSFDSDQDPLESKPMAEINVTPMVDVMLVLLVIFMVAAPLMTGSVPVDLPKGTRAQKSIKEAPLILTLDVQKKLYVGKKHVVKDQLASALG